MPARTELDIPIMIPDGNSRKLVVLWGTNEASLGTFPTVTFDPDGEALLLDEDISDQVAGLRVAAYHLDNPAVGSKVVRIDTTPVPVRSVARLQVVQDCRPGPPQAATVVGADTFTSFVLIEPDDAFSETADLILDDTHGLGELAPAGRQVSLDEDLVDGSFLARTSRRPHTNNELVNIGWTANTAAAVMAHVAINMSHAADHIVSTDPVVVARWSLDGSGPSFVTTPPGGQPLVLHNGTILSAVNPLLADGGTSISMQTSGLLASADAVRQVPTWWNTIFCQPRSLPTSDSHRNICNADVQVGGGKSPGMWSLEHRNHNDAGVNKSRIRCYIRDTSALGQLFGPPGGAGTTNGVGDFTLNVGHRIDWMFDGTKGWLYLDKTLIGDDTAANLAGMQGAAALFEVGVYATTQGPFDGIIDEIVLRSGVPADHAAALALEPNAQTVSDPGPASVITAVSETVQTVVQGNTDVDVLANDLNKPAGHEFDIDIVPGSDANARCSVINDQTTTAKVRITMPAPVAADRDESARYKVRSRPSGGSYGNFSGEATLPWHQEGTGGVLGTFPFVTTFIPPANHTGMSSRPGFSPSDPESASYIDPMSGIQCFRLGGNMGSTVYLRGTVNSGLTYPRRLRQENSGAVAMVWNRDGTMCMVDRFYDASLGNGGNCQSYLIDVNASRGGNKPWQIIRAATAAMLDDKRAGSNDRLQPTWFWDLNPANNPGRAYIFLAEGVYEWFPFGDGGSRDPGFNQKIFTYPSGATFGDARGERWCPSADGRFFSISARRNDGVWGGYRLDLATGAFGSFRANPNPVNDAEHRGVGKTSAKDGQYSTFTPDDTGNFEQMAVVDMKTGALRHYTSDAVPARAIVNHFDACTVDDKEYLVGPRDTNNPFALYEYNTNKYFTRCTAAHSNPTHASCRALRDTMQNHGVVGGSSSGLRYAIWSKTRDNYGTPSWVMGVRLGKNDIDKVRYLLNPRSTKSKSTGEECHAQPDPDMKYIIWNSDWGQMIPAESANYYHPYIAIMPKNGAWYRQHNSGMSDIPD